MKAFALLSLLAILIVPTSAIAEGLPPLWEPGEWTGQSSLSAPAPKAVLWITGSGGFAGEIEQEQAVDLPPAIRLLGDKAFRSALCRELRATEAKALETEIEREVADYARSFDELFAKLWKLETPDAKTAEIAAFKEETSRRLGALRDRLTPSQQAKCERRYASVFFYWHGPVEFARRMGASREEIREIRTRLRELPDPLRTQLRDVETATLLEILSKLDGRGVEALRTIVKSASPRRPGVLFALHDDLASFDAPPTGMTKGAFARMHLYRLGPAGTFEVEFHGSADPLLDVWGLVYAAELDELDREVASKALNEQVNARAAPGSEHERLSAEAEELRGKLSKKEGDTFEVYAALARVEIKLFDLGTDQANAALRSLSEDGRRAVEEGLLLFYMQRHGCTGVLASKLVNERLGLSIGPASWQTLDGEAPKIAASLRARAVEVQREVVKSLYRETSLENEFEQPWASAVEEDYLPPLETLTVHAKSWAK